MEIKRKKKAMSFEKLHGEYKWSGSLKLFFMMDMVFFSSVYQKDDELKLKPQKLCHENPMDG